MLFVEVSLVNSLWGFSRDTAIVTCCGRGGTLLFIAEDEQYDLQRIALRPDLALKQFSNSIITSILISPLSTWNTQIWSATILLRYGLGPYATGGPVGVWTPPVVGLIGVINSDGRIHEGERLGHAGLSTFSSAASTDRLALTLLHIFAESVA